MSILLQVIDVGFFVCLDSFLSLLTFMPIRLVTTCWRLLKTRYPLLLQLINACDNSIVFYISPKSSKQWLYVMQ
ncbi:hypothetical protein Hanom_Chr15g01368081 [Helianthus anomalus]